MGKNSIGSSQIDVKKHLGFHGTTLGCTSNPESIAGAKGIDYVNGQTD